MRQTDRNVGIGIAALALLVLWTARDFPNVPGQKLGAAFLPVLIGAGLLLCAIGLLLRKRAADDAGAESAAPGEEHFGSSALTIGAVVVYILACDAVGFLLLAPMCLFATFLAQRVRVVPAILWSLGGTLLVHVAFYKLLRVPLPWGVLTPLY